MCVQIADTPKDKKRQTNEQWKYKLTDMLRSTLKIVYCLSYYIFVLSIYYSE